MSQAFPPGAVADPRAARSRAPRHPGGFHTRLVEAVVLIAAGLLLAVATVDDVARQVRVNHRLDADLRSWRSYARLDFHSLAISQDFTGLSTKDIVCGNTSPGVPKERVQLCLVVTGTVHNGRRTVSGGWYLPPRVEDLKRYRYACFGDARGEARCPR
jgi:hypothetical protein